MIKKNMYVSPFGYAFLYCRSSDSTLNVLKRVGVVLTNFYYNMKSEFVNLSLTFASENMYLLFVIRSDWNLVYFQKKKIWNYAYICSIDYLNIFKLYILNYFIFVCFCVHMHWTRYKKNYSHTTNRPVNCFFLFIERISK